MTIREKYYGLKKEFRTIYRHYSDVIFQEKDMFMFSKKARTMMKKYIEFDIGDAITMFELKIIDIDEFKLTIKVLKTIYMNLDDVRYADGVARMTATMSDIDIEYGVETETVETEVNDKLTIEVTFNNGMENKTYIDVVDSNELKYQIDNNLILKNVIMIRDVNNNILYSHDINTKRVISVNYLNSELNQLIYKTAEVENINQSTIKEYINNSLDEIVEIIDCATGELLYNPQITCETYLHRNTHLTSEDLYYMEM